MMKRLTDEPERPDDTQARILTILSMTRRPLASMELAQALGTVSLEITGANDWLTRNGYITQVAASPIGHGAAPDLLWSLAPKGREWASARDALARASL